MIFTLPQYRRMPQEVSESPSSEQLFTAIPMREKIEPRSLIATGELKHENDFLSKIQGGITHETARLKQKFLNDIDPNDEALLTKVENEVETVCDILWGPLRLDSSLLREEKEFSEHAKETSARIQHAITHAAYYGGTIQADPEYSASIYRSLQLGRKLAYLPQMPHNTQLITRWHGIQNELAVVKTLKRGGYQVFLPDYGQDTFSLPDNTKNEVLQLDVKSGIDLIAVKNGKTLLLDSKGKNTQEYADVQNLIKVNPHSLSNTCVRDVLDRIQEQTMINPQDCYKATIMIPGNARSFKELELPDNPNDPKIHLSQFGRIDENLERSILMQLNNPNLVASLRRSLKETLISTH